MKSLNSPTSPLSPVLGFAAQALLAVSVVVTFVLLLHAN